jgi:hypothetical protein
MLTPEPLIDPDEPIKAAPYTKAELRELLGYKTRKTFLQHIQPIIPDLEKLGYDQRCKKLTRAQSRVIINFLG